jgi:hypothetical protein
MRAVRLEDALGQFKADRRNLATDAFFTVVLQHPPLWHFDAAGGRPPRLSWRNPALSNVRCPETDGRADAPILSALIPAEPSFRTN